jgi:hypothetical protein
MYMFYFWQRWGESGCVVDEFYFLLSVVTLVLSTSTTAYLMLVVFGALSLLDKAVDWWRVRRPGPTASAEPIRIRGSHLVSALALLILVIAGVWFVDRNRETIDAAIELQIRSKGESISYEVRANADRMAWRIFLGTYGLGAGLGSHRSSSGLLALLAGTGLIGTLAFAWLMAVVTQGPPVGIKDAEAGKALRWAVLGMLGSQAVAGPDLQSLPLWTCTGLIIGIRLAPRAVALASPPMLMTTGPAPSLRSSGFDPDRLRIARAPSLSNRSDPA